MRNFRSNLIARVDPAGNDTKGEIGYLNRPFKTVQGALDAISAANLDPNLGTPLIDVGNNNFTENLTTPLTNIAFQGIGSENAQAFSAIEFTEPTQQVAMYVFNVSVNQIVVDTTGSFFLELDLAGAQRITTKGAITINSDSRTGIIGDVAAAGKITLQGLKSNGSGGKVGTSTNDEVNITACLDGYPINVNSPLSNVSANLSIIQVTAANGLQLQDARVYGALPAGFARPSYTDVLLSFATMDGNSLPTTDPHVLGLPWNNAGVVNISAG